MPIAAAVMVLLGFLTTGAAGISYLDATSPTPSPSDLEKSTFVFATDKPNIRARIEVELRPTYSGADEVYFRPVFDLSAGQTIHWVLYSHENPDFRTLREPLDQAGYDVPEGSNIQYQTLNDSWSYDDCQIQKPSQEETYRYPDALHYVGKRACGKYTLKTTDAGAISAVAVGPATQGDLTKGVYPTGQSAFIPLIVSVGRSSPERPDIAFGADGFAAAAPEFGTTEIADQDLHHLFYGTKDFEVSYTRPIDFDNLLSHSTPAESVRGPSDEWQSSSPIYEVSQRERETRNRNLVFAAGIGLGTGLSLVISGFGAAFRRKDR